MFEHFETPCRPTGACGWFLFVFPPLPQWATLFRTYGAEELASGAMIAELFFQPAPFWAGTEGALEMRVPEHLRKWPRYHVSVRFNQPISGPILAGIGRHYGVGLFAAAWEGDRV